MYGSQSGLALEQHVYHVAAVFLFEGGCACFPSAGPEDQLRGFRQYCWRREECRKLCHGGRGPGSSSSDNMGIERVGKPRFIALVNSRITSCATCWLYLFTECEVFDVILLLSISPPMGAATTSAIHVNANSALIPVWMKHIFVRDVKR